MGHEVKLTPGKFVKAFVMGDKNDAVDAKAIWLAVQHAERSVAAKTETQQAALGRHRMLEQLVKFRTMQINALRGLLTEYGEVMGKGRPAVGKAIPSVLERLVDPLPVILIDTLCKQWNGLAELDKQIAGIEPRLQKMSRLSSYQKLFLVRPPGGMNPVRYPQGGIPCRYYGVRYQHKPHLTRPAKQYEVADPGASI